MNRMDRVSGLSRLVAAVVLLTAALILSCGGGNPPPPPPPKTFTLTVTKAGSGLGTVVSSVAGINCGSDCSETYKEGTSVTLTATAASGSLFSGWSGACTRSGTCILSMTANRSVTAAFDLAVSIAISPETASVYAGGSQQFTATVTGTSNTAVTWSVSDNCGSVSDAGLYTAPWAICSGTVKATSKADTTKSASASVDVVSEIALARVIDSGGVGAFASVAFGVGGKVYASGFSGTNDIQFGVVVGLNPDFSDNWRYLSSERSGVRSLLITPEHQGKLFFDGIKLTDPNAREVWFGRLNAESGTLEKEQSCRIGGNNYVVPVQYLDGRFYIGIFDSWNGPALVTADGDCNLDCEHPINIRPAGGDMYDFALMPGYIVAAGTFSCSGGTYNCTWVAKVDYAGNPIVAEKIFVDVINPHIAVVEENGEKVIYVGATDITFSGPGPGVWVQKLRESDLVEFWPSPIVTFGGNTGCPSQSNFLMDLVPSPAGGATGVVQWEALSCTTLDVGAVLVSPSGELLRTARSALSDQGLWDSPYDAAYDSNGRLFLSGQHTESGNGYPALYTWRP